MKSTSRTRLIKDIFSNAECAGFWSQPVFHKPAKAQFVKVFTNKQVTILIHQTSNTKDGQMVFLLWHWNKVAYQMNFFVFFRLGMIMAY